LFRKAKATIYLAKVKGNLTADLATILKDFAWKNFAWLGVIINLIA
jgi:hypothetical protein